ncbi:hypothetical protein [Aureimonas glaciei]|uniref:hypothetical protein n=1 Tax=Aureimonas glaciei TaxID=1776957 RepID=UPI00166647B6|nr:hypothetical protein [Aureimonas glaciei]
MAATFEVAGAAAWVGVAVAQAGISREMVRDLIVTAVERRFGKIKVPHAAE